MVETQHFKVSFRKAAKAWLLGGYEPGSFKSKVHTWAAWAAWVIGTIKKWTNLELQSREHIKSVSEKTIFKKLRNEMKDFSTSSIWAQVSLAFVHMAAASVALFASSWKEILYSVNGKFFSINFVSVELKARWGLCFKENDFHPSTHIGSFFFLSSYSSFSHLPSSLIFSSIIHLLFCHFIFLCMPFLSLSLLKFLAFHCPMSFPFPF